MLPLGLSLLLLGFWGIVGRALLAASQARLGALRSWLLAPGCGLAVQVLAVAVGNQAGLPVRAFAIPLAAGLLAAALAVLVWRRPVIPGPALLPFALIAGAFLVWAGWPAFRFGFDWISYVNDDFTNYCLSAERFKNFGFARVPTLTELGGTDYTQYFWFMHVLTLIRFGAEQTLAFVASVTGLNALRIFMPVILAFAEVQILAAAGLVLHHGRWRRQAGLTALLLAARPLFLFGALYQLIAQVGGLALMLTTLAVFTAPVRGRSRWSLLGRAVPMAVAASALALFYPECSPFALVAYGLYVALEVARTRRFPGARVVALEYALMLIVVCLRFNLISYIYTFGGQLAAGVRQNDLSLSLFPFFLIPQGLSMLFGLQPLNRQLDDPAQSLLIVLGMALLLLAVAVGLRRSWVPLPFACLLVVEAAVGARFFAGGNDFALYKLAMYIQPALLAGVATGLLSLSRRRWVGPLAAAGLLALALPTGFYYTAASRGSQANGMTEMQRASGALSRRPAVPPPGNSWASGIDNVVAVKIAANFYRGPDLRFFGRDFFFTESFLIDSDWPLMGFYPYRGLYAAGHTLIDARYRVLFDDRRLFGTDFQVTKTASPPSAYLNLPASLSLFNKLKPAVGEPGDLFTLQPASDIHNLLIFVHSTLGNHYYLGDRRKISFLQQEPDPYRPGLAMNGIGRYFLFRIENPSPEVYLRVAATKTVMGPTNKSWSGAAVVRGARDVPLGLVGAGAENRIVGPITPVWVDGAAYVAVDLAQVPVAFPIKRTGFSRLYNRAVPLDYRRLVAFGRDISALSPAEYDALPRPRGVERFPDDLSRATGLEFSGLYEDRWVSPAADLILGEGRPGETVRLVGYVPTLPGLAGQAAGRLTVTINGEVQVLPSPPGRFDWILPIARPGPKTRIELRFSCPGVLPPGDDRPVGGQIDYIKIEPAPASFAFGPGLSAMIPASGIDSDGWAAPAADLSVPVPAGSEGVQIRLEYPGWPGMPATGEIDISADGADPVRCFLKPGPNLLTLPLRPGPLVRRLHLVAPRGFQLPAPDGRVRAYRILSVSGTPAPVS